MNRGQRSYGSRSLDSKHTSRVALVLLLLVSGLISSCGQGGGDATPISVSTNYLTYDFFDSNGARIKEVRYYGFGSDGIWLTNDDEVSYYTEYSYDVNGNEIESVRYFGPGADGSWFTGDDEIFLYTLSFYDEFGNRTGSNYYSGPGSDGLWRTADDESIAISATS